MENQKSNNKLVVTLIIIIICLVLGGGYTIYSLLPKNSNSGTSENNNSNVSDENNNESISDVTDTTKYNSYVVDTLSGNITVERHTNSETTEYYLQYTKKENNKTVWTYKTESDYAAQYDKMYTIKNLDDKLYINDKGNIVLLNKETGKVVWKNSNDEKTLFIEIFFDKNQNLYAYTSEDSLLIIDNNGKTKKVIKHESMKSDCNEGIYYEFTNDNYLGIGGACNSNPKSNVYINLNDYSIKTTK